MLLRHPLFATTLLAVCLVTAAAGADQPITADEFQQLTTQLHIKSQPWAAIPWRASVTEARQAAAREGKPLFLIVNTGNCLGFV